MDNSVLANTIALVGTGDSATLLQRGFHGPLYKTYLQGKFGVGAGAISKYICIFGGEEEIDNAPSVSDTLKCSIAPATCVLRDVPNPFSCFGSGSGDDASLVWYCQDIFKWRSEPPAVQVGGGEFDGGEEDTGGTGERGGKETGGGGREAMVEGGGR